MYGQILIKFMCY